MHTLAWILNFTDLDKLHPEERASLDIQLTHSVRLSHSKFEDATEIDLGKKASWCIDSYGSKALVFPIAPSVNYIVHEAYSASFRNIISLTTPVKDHLKLATEDKLNSRGYDGVFKLLPLLEKLIKANEEYVRN